MISHANSTGKWAVQGMSRRKSIQQKKTAFAVFFAVTVSFSALPSAFSSLCIQDRNSRLCSRILRSRSSSPECAGPYTGRQE